MTCMMCFMQIIPELLCKSFSIDVFDFFHEVPSCQYFNNIFHLFSGINSGVENLSMQRDTFLCHPFHVILSEVY